MSDFKNIWTEKYRPTSLEDIILPEATKKLLNTYISEEEIPNLLFCGSPGIGKTTTARILVGPKGLNCNYLYINASDENGIDTIRTKISNFAQTKSFDGKVKVVVLDEADGLTIQGQQALRNTMESCSRTCRFILTANHKHKMAPAIQSRCMAIEVKVDLKESVKRCASILREENILIPEEQKPRFVELVKSSFPDMRKTINNLQRNIEDGALNIVRIGADSDLIHSLWCLIADNDTVKIRKYLIDNEERFSGDYDVLLTNALEHLYSFDIIRDQNVKCEMIVAIADYMYKSAFVLDKEINAYACWLTLARINMPKRT